MSTLTEAFAAGIPNIHQIEHGDVHKFAEIIRVDGRDFNLKSYLPPQGSGPYPDLLLTHGLASNANFFQDFAQTMASLGVGIHILDLPRHKAKLNQDKLLDWQVEALAQAYRAIKLRSEQDTPIVIGGHSRGAIVAARAGEMILRQEIELADKLAGTILMAPAGFSKIGNGNLLKAAFKNGIPLAFNVLRHGGRNNVRYLASTALSSVLSDPRQFLTEANHAISENILKDVRYHAKNGVPVFIIAAEKDGAIDHNFILESIYKFVVSEGEKNDDENKQKKKMDVDMDIYRQYLSFATIFAAHDLKHAYRGKIDPTDPRTLTGQIHAFLSSLADIDPTLADFKH